jgi:NADPH2:quinone reductase
VFATASSDERLKPLFDLGLNEGIDYSRSGWVDQVRTLTGGTGVDLVVDSVGGHVLAGSVACLAYRGRCITVGSAGREEQLLDVRALGAGNQSITGVFLGAEIITPRAQTMIRARRRAASRAVSASSSTGSRLLPEGGRRPRPGYREPEGQRAVLIP